MSGTGNVNQDGYAYSLLGARIDHVYALFRLSPLPDRATSNAMSLVLD